MENEFLEGLRDLWTGAGRRYIEQEAVRGRRMASLANKTDWRLVEDEVRVANRLRRKGMDTAMAESLVDGALNTPQLGNLLLERIINESELLDIAFLRTGARLSRGVARIQLRSPGGRVLGHGTGFMVSPRLMMTNNHVLADAGSASSARAQFDYVASSDGSEPNTVDFEFEPKVFFKTNRILDYTLIAVADRSETGERLSARPWSALIRESGKALVGEPVNIIQHPRGQTMKVAFRQNKIVDRLENFLHYETDTQRGSSGSKVCNDRWEIAALHHSGVPKMDGSGTILLDDGSPWDGSRTTMDRIEWVANEGVRISRIVEHLDGASMTGGERQLYDQCFEPAPEGETEFEGNERHQPDFVEENGLLRRIEEDGSVSWYFRVNFGPAIGAGRSSDDDPDKNYSGIDSNTKDRNKTAGVEEAKRKAEELLESFRPDQPYFDLAADKQDIERYYSDIDFELTPAKLYDALNSLVSDTHTTRLSYRSARLKHLYPWVDMRESRDLRNIYSGTILDAAELIAQELERFELARPGFLREVSAEAFDDDSMDELELALETSMPFNCEHVVPQSWFQKRQPMKADLHHLFTCEPSCNSFRSNIPYFDFEPLLAASPEMDLEVVRRECGQREGDKFEPEMGHGAVARATLYFLLRYPKQIGDEARELQEDRLDTLISWHETQRASRYEKHRNQAIFAVQGNRNPFIDRPELAKKIKLQKGFG